LPGLSAFICDLFSYENLNFYLRFSYFRPHFEESNKGVEQGPDASESTCLEQTMEVIIACREILFPGQ
jgi:hypothetical protein